MTSTISSSIMEQAIARVPALENAGVKQMINGPESFTPDGNFILGPAPECANMYVGAGFNAFGIASAAAPAGCWPTG
jgi:sarcosine dehydrogenase